MPYVPPHLRGKQQEGAGGGDAAPVTKGKSLSDLAESSSSGGSRGGRGGFDRNGGAFDHNGGGGGGRQAGWGGSSHGNGAPAMPQAADGTSGSRFAPQAAGIARFEARTANAAGAADGNDRRGGDNSQRGGGDAGGSDRFAGNGRRDGDNGDAGGRPYSTPSSVSGYKYNPKGAPSRFGSAGRNQNRPLEEGEDVPGGTRLDVEDGMVYDMGPGGAHACIYFQVLAPPPTPTSPRHHPLPSSPARALRSGRAGRQDRHPHPHPRPRRTGCASTPSRRGPWGWSCSVG